MLLRKLIAGSVLALSAVFALTSAASAADSLSSGKVVEKMIEQMTKLTSVAYVGEVDAKITSVDYGATGWNMTSAVPPNRKMKIENFNLGFSGATDIKDPLNLKGFFKVKVKTNAFTGKNMTLGAEFRILNNIGYLKLSSAANLGFFDLSALKNKWVRFDYDELEDEFGFDSKDDVLPMTDQKKEMTPAQVEKVKVALEKYDVIKITAELPDAIIDRVKTYHYKYAFDVNELKKFELEREQIMKDRALTANEISFIEQDFADLVMPSGEIWIGKTDFLPRKLTADLSIDEKPSSPDSAVVKVNLSLKNFNKAVKVTVPPKSQAFQEFAESMFGGF